MAIPCAGAVSIYSQPPSPAGTALMSAGRLGEMKKAGSLALGFPMPPVLFMAAFFVQLADLPGSKAEGEMGIVINQTLTFQAKKPAPARRFSLRTSTLHYSYSFIQVHCSLRTLPSDVTQPTPRLHRVH